MLKKIVLTGGPCGGKSTFVRESLTILELFEVKVLTSPEAATLLIDNGADLRSMGFQERVSWHYSVIKLQMAIEDNLFYIATKICSQYKHILILCDRGSLDSKAFCSPQEWDALLKLESWKESDLYTRYDEVIFMETVANLDPSYYLQKSISARIENPSQALLVDRKLYTEWSKHPDFWYVKSNINFTDKIKEVSSILKQIFENSPSKVNLK